MEGQVHGRLNPGLRARPHLYQLLIRQVTQAAAVAGDYQTLALANAHVAPVRGDKASGVQVSAHLLEFLQKRSHH
ncbi:MAG: hypothetical protein AMJ76_01340 [Dehalococcoidia bacterium SM23_28_1]|nr:MAG: hypothetical protein AMJ76_01340 [Dehalococcoidia bacterium SM23_28_1]